MSRPHTASDHEADLTRPELGGKKKSTRVSPGKLNSVPATHGGRRAGAGRPPSLESPVRQTIYLSQRHVALLDEYRAKHNLASVSEAIRHLLESW
jgi:hypothetical protein